MHGIRLSNIKGKRYHTLAAPYKNQHTSWCVLRTELYMLFMWNKLYTAHLYGAHDCAHDVLTRSICIVLTVLQRRFLGAMYCGWVRGCLMTLVSVKKFGVRCDHMFF